MWPGHRALHYYLTSVSTDNEDLREMCLHGTGICSQQYRSFYGSESRFAIHDNSAGSRSTITAVIAVVLSSRNITGLLATISRYRRYHNNLKTNKS